MKHIIATTGIIIVAGFALLYVAASALALADLYRTNDFPTPPAVPLF